MTLDSKHIAIVHDYLNQYGGAERVLEALLDLFPRADIYTLLYDRKKFIHVPTIHARLVRTSLLDIPLARRRHRFFIPLMPLAASSLDLGSNYDLIISATAGFAKGIRYDPTRTKHLCYCYTPLRYAWEPDYIDSRFRIQDSSNVLKLFLRPVLAYLKKWDYRAAQRPDKIIAISNHIADKVKKYYGRESSVIYPPLDMKKFYSDDQESRIKNQDYYLAGGRLMHYKNYDVIIRAFNVLGRPLKIIGRGPEEERLRDLAWSSKITFLGDVSDDELRELYQRARAFIFAGIEDFGLVMAEAQACGTPVIALNAGGAREIVEEGETGIFFDQPTASSLVDAVERFEALSASRQINPAHISARAARFAIEQFTKNFSHQIEKIFLN